MSPREAGKAAGRTRGHLPCLAIPFAEEAPDPMALAEAASGLCRIAWLIDGANARVRALAPLLDRLGTVVEVGGRSLDEAAEQVAGEEPAGIVSFHDKAIPLAAGLAARLGLGGPSEADAARLVDKLEQRDALAAFGIEVPGHWPLRADADRPLGALPARLAYPVVVKPRRGSGSRSTFLARSPVDLEARLAEEREAARRGPGRPHSAEMVVEEYLEGSSGAGTDFADYLSAELAADGEQVACLALTGRLPLAEPFRETGLFLPSDLPETEAKGVSELAVEAVRALGAPAGCYHVEIKLTPGGPRVIEVNGRPGGIVPDLLHLASGGFSLFGLAIRLALGDALEAALDRSATPRPGRIAFRRLLQPPAWATAVEAIGGLEELDEAACVTRIVTRRPPGSPLSWREGTNGYVVQVTGVVPDHAQLRAGLERIDATVRIRYAGQPGQRPPGA